MNDNTDVVLAAREAYEVQCKRETSREQRAVQRRARWTAFWVKVLLGLEAVPSTDLGGVAIAGPLTFRLTSEWSANAYAPNVFILIYLSVKPSNCTDFLPHKIESLAGLGLALAGEEPQFYQGRVERVTRIVAPILFVLVIAGVAALAA
jgi:hypothetical protein